MRAGSWSVLQGLADSDRVSPEERELLEEAIEILDDQGEFEND